MVGFVGPDLGERRHERASVFSGRSGATNSSSSGQNRTCTRRCKEMLWLRQSNYSEELGGEVARVAHLVDDDEDQRSVGERDKVGFLTCHLTSKRERMRWTWHVRTANTRAGTGTGS
ncbi:hypothetical protein TorRG33x02_147520 [Trema orientale]|uniref:Uncharacterized protein n=1 Tax=Trema orientale TaxID=63057 RepID=A0A2P5EV45_TREOI|nr:hypothetical protein TorRG33x02_147520 [Trema orientale]